MQQARDPLRQRVRVCQRARLDHARLLGRVLGGEGHLHGRPRAAEDEGHVGRSRFHAQARRARLGRRDPHARAPRDGRQEHRRRLVCLPEGAVPPHPVRGLVQPAAEHREERAGRAERGQGPLLQGHHRLPDAERARALGARARRPVREAPARVPDAGAAALPAGDAGDPALPAGAPADAAVGARARALAAGGG